MVNWPIAMYQKHDWFAVFQFSLYIWFRSYPSMFGWTEPHPLNLRQCLQILGCARPVTQGDYGGEHQTMAVASWNKKDKIVQAATRSLLMFIDYSCHGQFYCMLNVGQNKCWLPCVAFYMQLASAMFAICFGRPWYWCSQPLCGFVWLLASACF